MAKDCNTFVFQSPQPRVSIVPPRSKPGFVFSPGTPGPAGRDLQIDGTAENYAALLSVTPVRVGELWQVLNTGALYTWTASGWPAEDQGRLLQGPQGETGRGISALSIDGDDLVASMTRGPTERVQVPSIVASADSAAAAASSAALADGHRQSAQSARDGAETARDEAEVQASESNRHRANSAGARQRSEDARDRSEAAAAAAATSAGHAATSEVNAGEAAGQAVPAAQNAEDYAQSALSDRRRAESAREWIETIDPPSGWDDLRNKPDVFPPESHRHDYGDLDNVPSTFPPDAHTHVSADITDADFSTHANVIIRRNDTGHFTVPEPAEDAHPTSRGFVRDAIQQALSDLINGAPEHLDTLVEIAAQVEENEGGIADLLSAVGEKVSKTDAVYSRDSGASVVRRNDTGHIAVPNPNTGEHATPRAWVESQIAGTAAATPNGLARRDGDGRLSVAAPTSNGHVATKQYVDQTVSAADTATRALITALTERVATLETQYSTLNTAFQNHADAAVTSPNINTIRRADTAPTGGTALDELVFVEED